MRFDPRHARLHSVGHVTAVQPPSDMVMQQMTLTPAAMTAQITYVLAWSPCAEIFRAPHGPEAANDLGDTVLYMLVSVSTQSRFGDLECPLVADESGSNFQKTSQNLNALAVSRRTFNLVDFTRIKRALYITCCPVLHYDSLGPGFVC
ncbi:hypothetical protein RRG08_053886 [Elysia crispata]|uniref:Uncharacterized protein n=1 Tax=Elysia crispata TaxID=231223 RepID=A0AAE1D0V3_9GAST|nr:hypothetical protein RRG08_053886 [Elysia crispata]